MKFATASESNMAPSFFTGFILAGIRLPDKKNNMADSMCKLQELEVKMPILAQSRYGKHVI